MLRSSTVKTLSTILLCLLLAACSSPEEQKEKHYLKALEYIKQDNPKSAIIELRNAIQIDAKYADARYQLGLLYLKENEPKNAFGELVRAANLDHTNLDANLKAAEFYLITRKRDESRQLVERILDQDPAHEDALALLANIELIEGKFDQALAALEKIGDEVETSAKLLNIKGRILASQKDFAAAEEAFLTAKAADPDKIGHYSTLLRLYASQKEMAKSKELLEEMTAKFPDNVQTHLLYARYHHNAGNTEMVEQKLTKVVEIEPENPRYRLMLADFYIENGERFKAEEILSDARIEIEDNVNITAKLAKLYFERENFEQSRKLVDEILEKDSGHGQAKLLQARFSLRDNKVNRAIEILESLTNDFPKWSEPFFYLAIARFSLGEVDLAQYAVTSAIENDRSVSKYHTLLAQLYLTKGAFADAKNAAGTAIKLNTTNLRAALILTNAMIGMEEYEEAKKLLSNMNQQVPANLEILGNLAIAFLRSGDQEQGMALLEEILEISPGNNRAVMLLTALKYRNDLPSAENFLRQQIKLAPENSGLYGLLGDILLQQKKEDEALAAYEKGLEVNPNNIKAYSAAAILLSRLGQTDQAMAKYEDMISQNPKSLQGYMGIATLLERQGDSEKAMEYYRKALDIKPDFAPAANNLAWLIASTPDGDMGEALRLAMIAKKEYPESSHIADTLGWVYYKRGSYSLAIPQFEQALQGRSENPTIAYHLALAFNANGEQIKAQGILEELLRKDTAFPERSEAEALLAELKAQ